jgi:hypothetical protein
LAFFNGGSMIDENNEYIDKRNDDLSPRSIQQKELERFRGALIISGFVEATVMEDLFRGTGSNGVN